MGSTLILGNRNYSTWSLRGWWVAKRSGLVFDEIDLKLDTPEFFSTIEKYSPTGRVPVLRDDGLVIWDTLAIAEYLAEKFPAAGLWPADPKDRAMARSFCAEMHSGFEGLRMQLPMNCRARHRAVDIDDEARRDIHRVFSIWQYCREHHAAKGPWLFGSWSIVDAFFAPVVLRFRSYDIEMAPSASEWAEAVLNDTDLCDWLERAERETEIIEADEAGNPAS